MSAVDKFGQWVRDWCAVNGYDLPCGIDGHLVTVNDDLSGVEAAWRTPVGTHIASWSMEFVRQMAAEYPNFRFESLASGPDGTFLTQVKMPEHAVSFRRLPRPDDTDEGTQA